MELERMGGAFAKNGVARTKALEEATARFGDVPADWAAKLLPWDPAAKKAKDQAEFNSQLEKLAHHKAAD